VDLDDTQHFFFDFKDENAPYQTMLGQLESVRKQLDNTSSVLMQELRHLEPDIRADSSALGLGNDCGQDEYVNCEGGECKCMFCSAGKEPDPAFDPDNVANANLCRDCKEREVSSYGRNGAGRCTQCPAGKQPNEEKERCETCVAGKYTNGENVWLCQGCPGKGTLTSDNRTECLCMPGYYSYVTDNVTQDAAADLNDARQNCRPCPTLEEHHFDGWCPGGRPATSQIAGTGFAVVYPSEDFWIDDDWAKKYALRTFIGEGTLRNHTCDVSTVPHCLGHEWRENKLWRDSLPQSRSMNSSASANLMQWQTLSAVEETMCTGPYNITAPYFCKHKHTKSSFC
jgi:hypothetical protein